MTVKTFDELVAKVKSGKKSTVALVCANDAHALEAVIHASDLWTPYSLLKRTSLTS